jgi:transposase InsO family protein
MPWKVASVSQVRQEFVRQVRELHVPVSQAARIFGISRKTAYKWLARQAAEPEAPLVSRSRRPRRSPAVTEPEIERRILEVRRQYGWGARKIHALLAPSIPELPSIKTIGNILGRTGCIRAAPHEPPAPPLFFERAQPNELWQCDFKGPHEVARQRIHPFVVLDDYSRFLVALRVCDDLTMKSAFDALWQAFGEFGLPEAILSDNGFGTRNSQPKTLSWFEQQLIRLGIRPLHGRPFHPQTQGKVERFNGTLEREVWPFVRHDAREHFEADLERWRSEVYNPLRPHESLGDRPPATRFAPSPRPRPERVPEVEYLPGAELRKVERTGVITWHKFKIMAGCGLAGQSVRVEDRAHELHVYYAAHLLRSIPHDQLQCDTML